MRLNFIAAAALAGALVGASPALAAPSPPKTPAPRSHTQFNADPAVHSGVLDNGLHYFVMSNAKPPGAVSVRLTIKTGSYEESDAEQGFAHFIEHLAFRSSRTAPEGGLDRFFAPKGIEFGQDLNAFTDRDTTTFKLDLPKADPEVIKSGMGWMRDVADGVFFTEAAVAKERGVVLAEMEARGSLTSKASDQVTGFQLESHRWVNRDPIGTIATLNAATAQGLSRFHEKWYRPDNAILVIVGDLPIEQLEALVRSNFSSWKSSGPMPSRAPTWRPRLDRPVDAMVIAGATLVDNTTVCRTQDKEADAENEIAKLRRRLTDAVALSVLNTRLAQKTAKAEFGLLGANFSKAEIQDAALTCLSVVPLSGRWSLGFKSAQAELNTYLKDGPTELEVEAAIDKMRDGLRGNVLSAPSRLTKDIADDIMDSGVSGEAPGSPLDDIYHFDLAVEDMTQADVVKRLSRLWSGGGPFMSAVGATPPSRTELITAWTQGGKEQAEQTVAKASTGTWAYSSFGKPGKVIRRTPIADPGFVRLVFENGLVLNFKDLKGGSNQVMTSIAFGQGRKDIAKEDLFVAGLGSSAMIGGGLGKHDIAEIQQFFGDLKNWSFKVNIGFSTNVISNTTYKDSLETELQILAAYMSDPGFRPEFDARLSSAIDQVYRFNEENPHLALSKAMTEVIDPGLVVIFPDRAKASKYTSKDMERVLKAEVTQQPLELSIVGDLEEAAVIKMVASTFGALPKRTPPVLGPIDPGFQYYPSAPPPTVRTTHKGPTDKAAASLEWPLYVAVPERRREEYALKILSSVFDTALRQRIREELGKTYSPSVSMSSPDNADQATIRVVIEGAPADIDVLVQETKLVASRLSLGDISHDLIEGARQPMLASMRANRGTLGWWITAMMVSDRIPDSLKDVLDADTMIAGVTDEEVITAAAKWLAKPPFVGIANPAPKASDGARK